MAFSKSFVPTRSCLFTTSSALLPSVSPAQLTPGWKFSVALAPLIPPTRCSRNPTSAFDLAKKTTAREDANWAWKTRKIRWGQLTTLLTYGGLRGPMAQTPMSVVYLDKKTSKDIMRSVHVCVIEPLKPLFCEGSRPPSSSAFDLMEP